MFYRETDESIGFKGRIFVGLHKLLRIVAFLRKDGARHLFKAKVLWDIWGTVQSGHFDSMMILFCFVYLIVPQGVPCKAWKTPTFPRAEKCYEKVATYFFLQFFLRILHLSQKQMRFLFKHKHVYRHFFLSFVNMDMIWSNVEFWGTKQSKTMFHTGLIII